MPRLLVAGGSVPEAKPETADAGEWLHHPVLGKSPFIPRRPMRDEFKRLMGQWSDRVELTDGPRHVGVLFERQLIHCQIVRDQESEVTSE